MNAKPLLVFALAALVGLALVPAASAQPKVVAATAPVAQSGSSNLTFVEEGQQPASTPRPSRASSGWSAYGDQQAPPPPPAPQARSAGDAQAVPKVQMPMMQMPKGQLVNVKVEFTITDQLGTKPATKKTMTLIVADRESGRIRTTTQYAMPRGNSYTMGRAPLSVDVMPQIDGGKIRLEFTLEYDLNAEKEAGLPADAPGPSTNVSERLSAILESGVPLVIAQSSDAMTDRKLTIEVKATIVK
jgi:hypothetical protein